MNEPLITPDELGVYLNDSSINQERAGMLIEQAQLLCESILSPLPDAAAVVVMRVAGRAYVSTTSTRGAQMAAAGSPFGGAAPGQLGGVWLTRSDKADLRRLTGGGGSFTIDMLPTTFKTSLPWWDNGSTLTAYGFDDPVVGPGA